MRAVHKYAVNGEIFSVFRLYVSHTEDVEGDRLKILKGLWIKYGYLYKIRGFQFQEFQRSKFPRKKKKDKN